MTTNKQKLIALAKGQFPSLSERDLGFLYDDLLLSTHRPETIAQLWDSKIQALQEGTPLQHVSNIAHFYGTTFYVNDAVLIPRPETEELVYNILQDCKQQAITAPHILDIGTGSGCIPISLKEALPDSDVTAIDVSPEALVVAQRNAAEHEVVIQLLELDFRAKAMWTELPKYDIVVSNPPYIPHREKELMHEKVLAHEPHVALFVADTDPLLFYRLIAEFGHTHLTGGGSIYLELNEYNAPDVADLYAGYGYQHVQVLADLQGKDRMCVARLG